ncbi:hypothetical protein GFK26_18495 [Variovorax paradoxus]|uniref:Uncharacterized protein n=1 Tax=Variovorax paradoxus TaxID=34073 RepID=A0A5Q0M729_VARPD|nr:hypothetical protein [Variovorax paradoxus]QFZ84617.1 hypothetical protein GFK26_18495 [Variovorax paradoxus]
MKLKITEPGWANFTGDFGMVAFVDGVSVDDVPKVQAASLAGLIAIETLEGGVNPSASQILLDAHHAGVKVEAPPVHIPETPAADKIWTAEELAAIADAKGMKGIREVADPMGLKDNSVNVLMTKIIAHQAKK